MTLQQTQKNIQDHLHNGVLTLNETIIDLADLNSMLEASLGVDSFDIKDVAGVTLSNSEVKFAGTTSLLGFPDLDIDVSIRQDNSALQLVFFADLASDWLIGQSPSPVLSDLKDDAETDNVDGQKLFSDQLTTENPQLVFSTTTYQDRTLNYKMEKGLNFIWTNGQGPDQQAATIGCPVTLEDNILSFTAALPYAITFGKVSFKNVAFAFSCAVEDQSFPAQPNLSLSGKLYVGALEMTVEGSLDLLDFDVALDGTFDNLTIDGYAVLEDLIGLGNLGDFLPQALKNAANLTISGICFRFNPITATVISVALDMKTTTHWAPVPGLFSINDIAFQAEVHHPFDSDMRDVTGAIIGILTLADADISVTALLPDGVLMGELAQGQTLELKELLKTIAPGIKNVPQLSVNMLDIRIDPANNSYTISTTMENDWVVSAGITEFTLKKLFCNLSATSGTVTGALRGIIAFAGSEFEITSSLPDFRMTGALFGDKSVSLKAVLDELMPGDNSLPPTTPSFNITDPEFMVSPTTGEFEFKGVCKDTWLLPMALTTVSMQDIDLSVARKKISNSQLNLTEWGF
jgi:hypothetical protein